MNRIAQDRKVLRMLCRGVGRYLLYYFAAVYLVFGLVDLFVGVFGHIHYSIWEIAQVGTAKYVPFAFSMVLGAQLTVYVAHGVTRRNFLRATITFVLLVGVASGVATTLGYTIEHAFYSLRHLPTVVRTPHIFTSTGQWPAILLESVVIMTAYVTSGWLIGAGYYRLGGRYGTAFLLPAVVPALGTELVLHSGWEGVALTAAGAASPSVAIGVAVGVVLIAAGLVAGHALLRDAPVGRAGRPALAGA